MKDKNKLFNKIFVVAFCTITLSIMLVLADLFSGFITVGSYSFASENISVSEYTVYAVCTSSYNKKILADEMVETIQQQGGAGYVYAGDKLYYLIAGIYQTKGDAEKVAENIISSKPQTSIIAITAPAITLSSNLDQTEKNAVNKSISLFKSMYKDLYDIAVSLDTALIEEITARLQVNQLSSEVSTNLNDFETLFSNSITTELLKIKLALQEMQTYLNNLINSSSILPFTALVKQTYCHIVVGYKNLCEGLN